MIAILDEIAEAHARGESLIAVNRSKRPWYSWKPFQTERASLEQLERWAADHRTSAFAVITGEISACVVLDFDEEDGIRLLKRLALEPHVETGRGGFHVRLPHPGHRVGTQNSKVTQLLEAKWPGLDIRGDGGYAIEWGSSEFGSYRILRDLSEPVPIEALPEELAVDLGLVPAPSAGGMFDHVLAGTATGSTSPPRRSRKIVKGHRHRHLLEIGSAMRGRGCGELEILQELRRVNLADCEPPKPEEEVGKLAADIVARFPRGGPAGDREREDPAAELRHRLTAALKVGPADLEVVGAEIHGTRGPQAVCAIHPCDPLGQVITIEVGRYSQLLQPMALSGLVAAFTGVGEPFKQTECATIAGLVTRLAAHENVVDENQIAEDWGMAWLDAAGVWDVDLDAQGERWGAVLYWKGRDPVALARADHRSIAAHSTDLRDLNGNRYVHSRWFLEFVRRDCSGQIGAPELYGRMCRVGWQRRGQRSRIKARDPGGTGEMAAPVFIIPAGWKAGS